MQITSSMYKESLTVVMCGFKQSDQLRTITEYLPPSFTIVTVGTPDEVENRLEGGLAADLVFLWRQNNTPEILACCKDLYSLPVSI